MRKDIKLTFVEPYKYERIYPKISGYTTCYNCETLGVPYIESIKSMLGFCDEVVVLDGVSDDGTYEKLEELAGQDDKIKLYQNEFDWSEPGIDGNQKAFARALCENDFCWQQDADEIVSEEDYEKIKMITKRFPSDIDILHLPMIELWGDENHCTARRHLWKWRLSRNKPEITQGINKYARIINEETGQVYSNGNCDGCSYINVMSQEPLPHTGFYNQNLELLRIHAPEEFEKAMNNIYANIPSIFHYSWFNLSNKIKQLKPGGTWEKLWSLLFQKECQDRFSDVNTEEEIKECVKKLHEQGGEDSDQLKYKFKLLKKNPEIMKEWIEKNKEDF